MISTNLLVTDCNACNIARLRTNIVSGRGNKNADIMIIGEAPGYYEDKEGLPFVGKSGKLLTKVLWLAGFLREDVYITNMIKCRPTKNRAPTATELSNCVNHLIYEINMVKPKIIVLLGRTATQNIMGKHYNLYKVNGKIKIVSNFVFMPMYHPSYILRQNSINVTKKYVNNFILLAKVYTKLVDPLHRINI